LESSANHHGRGLRLTHQFPLPNSFTRPATPNYQNLAGVSPFGATQADRSNTALGRDDDERIGIRRYRKAVESAAAGKMGESFERLDKMGAVVACGLGDQADKLADEYLRLAEQDA